MTARMSGLLHRTATAMLAEQVGPLGFAGWAVVAVASLAAGWCCYVAVAAVLSS